MNAFLFKIAHLNSEQAYHTPRLFPAYPVSSGISAFFARGLQSLATASVPCSGEGWEAPTQAWLWPLNRLRHVQHSRLWCNPTPAFHRGVPLNEILLIDASRLLLPPACHRLDFAGQQSELLEDVIPMSPPRLSFANSFLLGQIILPVVSVPPQLNPRSIMSHT